jgi:hypothetical protein
VHRRLALLSACECVSYVCMGVCMSVLRKEHGLNKQRVVCVRMLACGYVRVCECAQVYVCVCVCVCVCTDTHTQTRTHTHTHKHTHVRYAQCTMHIVCMCMYDNILVCNRRMNVFFAQ